MSILLKNLFDLFFIQGKLCELCPKQFNGEKCEANYENPFYGDKGALDCLKDGTGDVALLEVGNIKGKKCISYG